MIFFEDGRACYYTRGVGRVTMERPYFGGGGFRSHPGLVYNPPPIDRSTLSIGGYEWGSLIAKATGYRGPVSQ